MLHCQSKDELHEVPQKIAPGLVVFIKFINDVDDDTKRIIIKFADNFKQQETARTLEARIKIQ